MKQTRLLMGMPITVEVVDSYVKRSHIQAVYDYFSSIDERFSTYKSNSEISLLNKKEIAEDDLSVEMKVILSLCEQTKQETLGYFDIGKPGYLDPSGLVKGWAINNAATILSSSGLQNFFIDAGGDIQMQGLNASGHVWRIGIRNPFNRKEIVKVLALTGKGIATSGTAIRGQHIYNPHHPETQITDIVSVTVIGPNIYEADRFATAAFAMGSKSIQFIESVPELEGYMIDTNGIATMTSGFNRYVQVDENTKTNAF